MDIKVNNTEEAKQDASTLISSANTLQSIVSTMETLRNNFIDNWKDKKGKNADRLTIIAYLNDNIHYYNNKIIPALTKLGNAINAYATATELLASSGVTPSQFAASNEKKVYGEQYVNSSKNSEKSIIDAQKISIDNGKTLNLTYYYPNDNMRSGTSVGGGFGINDFNVNENGWYTKTIQHSDGTSGEYVVLAGPTDYKSMYQISAKREGKEYFKYGDIFSFSSGGKTYNGVMLDSCGQAMREDTTLFDVFVQNAKSINPTNKNGVEQFEKIGHVDWSYGKIGILNK